MLFDDRMFQKLTFDHYLADSTKPRTDASPLGHVLLANYQIGQSACAYSERGYSAQRYRRQIVTSSFRPQTCRNWTPTRRIHPLAAHRMGESHRKKTIGGERHE